MITGYAIINRDATIEELFEKVSEAIEKDIERSGEIRKLCLQLPEDNSEFLLKKDDKIEKLIAQLGEAVICTVSYKGKAIRMPYYQVLRLYPTTVPIK